MTFKIEASKRIKAAESWSEYKKGNEQHDKEYEKTLKTRIQNLEEDIRDIKGDGDDASKEEDQLKRSKEELTNLQKRIREHVHSSAQKTSKKTK